MSAVDANFRFITTLEANLSLSLPSNPVLARDFLAKYFSVFGVASIAAPVVFKRYVDVLTPILLANYKNSIPYVYTTITVMSFLAYLLNANRLKAKKKRFLQNAHLQFPSKIANPCGRIEKDSGDRIRIVFDGSKINTSELKRDLYLLKGASITTCKNKIPPSRIILKNFEFTGEELFLPLAELSTTKRLVFIDCLNLEEGHIKNILKILPSICRIDFIGCDKISREFATSINRDVRYLERSNARNRNKDLLFDAFMADISTTLLKPELSIRVSRKLKTTSGREPSYANLIELKELLDTPIPATPTSLNERDTRISELFSSLRGELNPLDKEESEKRATERNLRSFISSFLSRPYIRRLDSRFTINLSNHFIGPLGVTALFELMSKINANLVKLDLSNTFVSGEEFEFAKGLPITALVLKNLENFRDENLKYLKTLPELEYLYLSGTAIDNMNFFRHLSSITNLKILFLNNCGLLINPVIRNLVYNKMSTLRLVSLENTQLNSETRDLLVARGCEDQTKPFIVVSSSDGLRRVDISLNDVIDWPIMDFLNKIPYIRGENPIQELSFAKGFTLSEADFIREESRQRPQGLLRLEKFQIQNLNLTGVDAEVTIFQHLAKKWPLQKLLLDDAEVIIEGSNPQDLPQAIKITINLIQKPTLSLKEFLNSFSRIGEIEINHGQHLIGEDRAYLDELFRAKNVRTHSVNIDREVDED